MGGQGVQGVILVGWDGMDGSGGHQMMHSNYRTSHQSWLYRCFLTVGCIWWGFQVVKKYI